MIAAQQGQGMAELFNNSFFSLALCAGLGLLIGFLIGRLIGAGRDLTGVFALAGLVVGVILFGISVRAGA